MSQPTLSHAETIDALGGPAEVATALKIRSVSTVRYWRRRNSIPAWRFVGIARFAADRNMPHINVTSLGLAAARAEVRAVA